MYKNDVVSVWYFGLCFQKLFFFFKIEQMQKALPNMFSEFFLRKPILKAAFFSLFVFGFLNYTSSRGSWTHNLHPNPPPHSLGGRKWNLNYLIYSSSTAHWHYSWKRPVFRGIRGWCFLKPFFLFDRGKNKIIGNIMLVINFFFS